MSLWDDPRVRRGMERQLRLRHSMIADGDQPLGWKAGFGTPAAMEAIGTTAPLAGFLTSRSLLPDGAVVGVDEWTAPIVEVEVAARMCIDLPGGSSREAAVVAIGALAPAIELVDLDGPRGAGDVEDVLAGGIFHRHVVLGAFDAAHAGGAIGDVRITVQTRDGTRVSGADPAEAIGDLVDVVRAIADLLEDAGERLRAGEVLITGAAIPVFAAEPGDAVTCHMTGLGGVHVAFAPAGGV